MAFYEQKVPNQDNSFEFRPNSFYENENNNGGNELDKLLKADLSMGLAKGHMGLTNRPTADLKRCTIMEAFGVENDSKTNAEEPSTMHTIEASFFLDSLMDRIVWEIERSRRKVNASLEAVRPTRLAQKDVVFEDDCVKLEGKRKRVQFTSPMTTNVFHYCDEEESQEDTLPLCSDSEEEFPLHDHDKISYLEQECSAKKRKLMLTRETVHISSFNPLVSTNGGEEAAVEGALEQSQCGKTKSLHHSDDNAAGNSEVPEQTLKTGEEDIFQFDKKKADMSEPKSNMLSSVDSSDAIAPDLLGSDKKETLCQVMPAKKAASNKRSSVAENKEPLPVSKEVSVLISNESQDEVDEQWYAEIVKRKFAERENFDVEEMKEGLSRQSNGQDVGNGSNSPGSCTASSSNAHFLLSEEQLVPENSASETMNISALSRVCDGCKVELPTADLIAPMLVAHRSHTIESLELSPIMPESSLDTSHDSQDCSLQIVSQEEVMLDNMNVEDSPCNSVKEGCDENKEGDLETVTESFAAVAQNIEEECGKGFTTSTPIKNTFESSTDEYKNDKDIDMGEDTKLEDIIEGFVHQVLRAQISHAASEKFLDPNLSDSAIIDDIICASQENNTGTNNLSNDTHGSLRVGSEIDVAELASKGGNEVISVEMENFHDPNLCDSVAVDNVISECEEIDTGRNEIENVPKLASDAGGQSERDNVDSFHDPNSCDSAVAGEVICESLEMNIGVDKVNDAHGGKTVGSETADIELAGDRGREPVIEIDTIENILIESNVFSSKMADTCPVEAMGEEWSTRDSENAFEDPEIFSPQMVSVGIAQAKGADDNKWSGKEEEGFQKLTGKGGSQKCTGEERPPTRTGNKVTLQIADMEWCTREAESASEEPEISSPRVVRMENTERQEEKCSKKDTEIEAKILRDRTDFVKCTHEEGSTGNVQCSIHESSKLCLKEVDSNVEEGKDFTLYEQDISLEMAKFSQSDEEMLICDSEGFEVTETVDDIFKPLFYGDTKMEDHRLDIEGNVEAIPDKLTKEEERYLITTQDCLNQKIGEVAHHDGKSIPENVQSPAQRSATTSKKVNDLEKDDTIVPVFNRPIENSDLMFYEDDDYDHKQSTILAQETPGQVPFPDIPKKKRRKSAHENIKQEDMSESEAGTPSSDFERQSVFSWGARRRLFNDITLTNVLQEPDKCIVSNPVSSVPLKQYTNGVNIQCKMRPRSVVRLGLSKKKHARRLHPYWNASQIRSDGQVVPDVDVSDE